MKEKIKKNLVRIRRKFDEKRKNNLEEELIFLDECIEISDIEVLMNEKWGIPVIPIKMMELNGKTDKAIAEHLETEFAEFTRYFVTGNRGKGARYFLPNKNSCVIRINSELMEGKKSDKIKQIKKFLNTVRYPKKLLGKELLVTPREIIKKFPSGHTNIIKYKHEEV